MDEMVDDELLELRRLKSELRAKTEELLVQLKEAENGNQSKERDGELPGINDESKSDASIAEKPRQLNSRVTLTSSMNGIATQRVNKVWITDNIYKFTADLEIKRSIFNLEVTAEKEEGAKIHNVREIKCKHKSELAVYDIEIAPWVRRFTEAKDMRSLLNAISDYGELNAIRSKLAKKLEITSLVNIEQLMGDEPGLNMTIRQSTSSEFAYLKVLWSLRWMALHCKVDHVFVIEPIAAGETFLRANSDLLQRFCEPNLQSDVLNELWSNLISVIENDGSLSSVTDKSL